MIGKLKTPIRTWKALAAIAAVCLWIHTAGQAEAALETAGEIPTGNGVVSLVLDEPGNRLFTLNAYSKQILVLNTTDNKVVKRIDAGKGRGPDVNMGGSGFAHDPVSDRLFYTDSGNAFYIADVKKGAVVRVVENEKGENGWMGGVYKDPGAQEMVVLDWYGNLFNYDVDGNRKSELKTGAEDVTYYMLTGNGGSIIAKAGGKLMEIGTRRGQILREYDYSDAGSQIGTPLLDDKTGNLFVGGEKGIIALPLKGKVKVLDNRRFILSVGASMALNPNTRHLFVPLEDDAVAVFDADTLKLIKTIQVGKMPRSIVVNRSAGLVYVACTQGGKIVIIRDN